jgi:hypothetical protein
MRLTDGQRKLMEAAFEGKDNTLPDQWRELICTLRDEVRAQERLSKNLDTALTSALNTLELIPCYKAGEPMEYVAAWIQKAVSLFEQLDVIRLAHAREIRPKATRRKAPTKEKEPDVAIGSDSESA